MTVEQELRALRNFYNMTLPELADKSGGHICDYAPKDGKRRKGKARCVGAYRRSTWKENKSDIGVKR